MLNRRESPPSLPALSATGQGDSRPTLPTGSEPSESGRVAFVLGSGTGNDIALIQQLARSGWEVHFGAVGVPATVSSRFAKSARVMPSDAAEWSAALSDWRASINVKDHSRPAIIPTNDAGVAWMLEDPSAHSDFATPMVDEKATAALFYKDQLYEHCRASEVPHTETIFVLDELSPTPATSAGLPFPLAAKPSVPKRRMTAQQTSKIVQIDDSRALEAFCTSRLADVAVVCCAYVPHHEKALVAMFLNHASEAVFEHTYLVRAASPRENGNAVICSPLHDTDMPAHARRLARSVGYRGFVEFEFIRADHDERWLLIDAQCRTTLQNAGLVAAGLDMPKSMESLLFGSPAPEPSNRRPKSWVDLPRLVERTLATGDWRERARILLLGLRLLASRRAVEATWNWRDSRSFARRLWWATQK